MGEGFQKLSIKIKKIKSLYMWGEGEGVGGGGGRKLPLKIKKKGGRGQSLSLIFKKCRRVGRRGLSPTRRVQIQDFWLASMFSTVHTLTHFHYLFLLSVLLILSQWKQVLFQQTIGSIHSRIH